jgi:flavin reductase (DIM6/NTAB) family NADH-FMN oxidoreductase RutF
MSTEFSYEQYASQFLKQLPRGAFLTVKTGDKLNTMTIGWGSIGYVWQKPVMMVMVRYSRYTYELMEKAMDFSVSVPLTGELKKDLAVTGTKSGRDIDKFKECKLTAKNAKSIESPVIGECGLIFECKIIYKQAMQPENLDVEIKEKCYPNDDFHVLYFGEIMSCYSPE